MNGSETSMAQQIAQAAIAFEQRRTGNHGPKSVTVVLSEGALVSTLQRSQPETWSRSSSLSVPSSRKPGAGMDRAIRDERGSRRSNEEQPGILFLSGRGPSGTNGPVPLSDEE
jgi:hypothetical protein